MKNIVICCDGTRNKYGPQDKVTNVVKLFERLAPDGPEQISFYDPGVGTYNPLKNGLGNIVGSAVESVSGSTVTHKLAEAYKYLMDHYESGDRIFLFGYSRGAYTVRDLAGLLHVCGLLTKGSDNLIPYAIHFYQEKEAGKDENIAFRFQRTFARPCRVHFIGVWDTVASVGWLWWRRYFRYARLTPNVNYAYQALAVDERRDYYRPSRWEEENLPGGQTVEQVWFPGCHADLGGQEADSRISDIPLEWMMKAAQQQELLLKPNWQDDLNPDPVGGNLRQSDRHVHRLRSHARAIDREGKRKVKIHESVVQRMEKRPDYHPTNLPHTYVEVPSDYEVVG